jgi:hypothetical protein
MPVIRAWIVRANLDDPRKILFLLVWKDERECHGTAYRLCDGETKEAVRLTCHVDPYARSPHNHVELKRTNGSATVLRIVWSVSLNAWYKVAKNADWRNFAEVRNSWRNTDVVGRFVVFDISHNRCRLIATIKYRWRMVYI